jgi:hypothetical protein
MVKMNDFDDERNKVLIEQREKYEQYFFEQIVDEMIESDDLDRLIGERLQYIDKNFEFEPSPAYERLEEIYYAEYDVKFQEQISDVDDYIDYPEGPDENLGGIRRDESFYENFELDYDELQIELEIEKLEAQELQRMEEDYENHLKMNEFNPAEAYEDLIQQAIIEEYDKDQEYMDSLIDIHIREEKDFIDDIVADAIHDAIIDEAYFERAIDEFIFDQIEIDYEPDFFDYDDRDEYWYDPHFDQPDESVIDPFDSFGEIDYPEGEPKYSYPVETDYHDKLQMDFEKYQRRKERLFGYTDEELPEPEDDLILEPPEDDESDFDDVDEKRNQLLIENRQKIESKFKDHFIKDDTLDKIIKEKLREKKFMK